jgi:hypothetical protein
MFSVAGAVARYLPESINLEAYAASSVRSPETLMHLGVCLWERRMYTTEGGIIGLAPAGTQVGVEVHIVLGAPAPFVLRRIEEVVAAGAEAESGTDSRPSYVIIGNYFQHNIIGAKRWKTEDRKPSRP